MSEAVRNWINASLVLLSTLGLSGLTCTMVTGCNDPQTGDTYEQRSTAADQRLQASKEVMDAFGIEGEAFVSVGPMRFGFEEVFVVDHGVRVQARLQTDPLKAKAYAKAMNYIDQGMSSGEAIEKTRTELNIPKTPASQPADDPPAEDEDD